jgi:hypothetical protein
MLTRKTHSLTLFCEAINIDTQLHAHFIFSLSLADSIKEEGCQLCYVNLIQIIELTMNIVCRHH